MVRRNTWILLVLLAALVGFSFYLKNRQAQQAASATPTGVGAGAAETPLFGSAEGTATDIKVQDTTGNAVEVSRNESGDWVLNAPTEAKAEQAAAQAAATQVTSLKVISSVSLGFDVVGLDKPSYTMTFKFSSGKSHTLRVGAETPIQDGYYSSLDGGPVRIVDKAGIDALTGLLAQPPFAATLTPAAPPETATAPSEFTSTPAASAAPAATETPASGTPAATSTSGATSGTATPTP